MKKWTFLTILSLFLTWSALAEERILFERKVLGGGAAVVDYDREIAKIKPGDDLIFSNKKKIRVGKLLGEGNTTKVFEILDSPSMVLRIPSSTIKNINGYPIPRFMTYFIKNYKELAANDTPVVHIRSSHVAEYAIVDRVSEFTPFPDFIKSYNTLDPALKEEMTSGLREFAKRTAKWAEIGDFRGDQMVYDLKAKKWVIIDWTNKHRLWERNALHNDSLIGSLFYGAQTLDEKVIARKLLPQLEEIVQSERHRMVLAKRPPQIFFREMQEVLRNVGRFELYNIAKDIFTLPFSVVLKDELALLISRSDQRTLELLRTKILLSPHFDGNEFEIFREAVEIDDHLKRKAMLSGFLKPMPSRPCIRSTLASLLFNYVRFK